MSEAHVSHKKTYILIFVVLATLTFVELFIPQMDAAHIVKGAWLSVIALVKAFLVAFYFMHLKEERAWLKFIASIPLAAFIYAFVVTLETLYR